MSESCTITATEDSANDENVFAPGPGKHVLFFGDPMCSWCWGFTPELAQLVQHTQNTDQNPVHFHVVMGGLRPGTVQAWDDAMRDYIRHHWEEVEAKTGQPFDFARFDDQDFVYDTEPGCRAVVTARELKPAQALPMYKALQQAFYAHNTDITHTQTLADLAETVGINRHQFLDFFTSDEARRRVMFDFQRTQAFGVQGFPSVLCAEDGQYAFLALGYRMYTTMQDDFEAWLNS